MRVFNHLFKSALLFVLILNIVECSDSSHNFLKGYMTIIKGRTVELDNNCLSGEFDKLFVELVASITRSDFLKIIEYTTAIVDLEWIYCPAGDIMQIAKDIKTSIRNGRIYVNMMQNSSLIREILKTEFMSALSDSNLFGRMIGKLTKLIVYGTSTFEKDLKFLS